VRLYFDSSAIVPLIIDEPGSPIARSLWDQGNQMITVRVSYAEVRAALARAHRQGRTTADEHRQSVEGFHQLWSDFYVVEVTKELTSRAGELAEDLALRGYDAIHLAAALTVEKPSLVLVAGDGALLEAATAKHLHVAKTS